MEFIAIFLIIAALLVSLIRYLRDAPVRDDLEDGFDYIDDAPMIKRDPPRSER